MTVRQMTHISRNERGHYSTVANSKSDIITERRFNTGMLDHDLLYLHHSCLI